MPELIEDDKIAQISRVIEKFERSKTWESLGIISGALGAASDAFTKVLDMKFKVNDQENKLSDQKIKLNHQEDKYNAELLKLVGTADEKYGIIEIKDKNGSIIFSAGLEDDKIPSEEEKKDPVKEKERQDNKKKKFAQLSLKVEENKIIEEHAKLSVDETKKKLLVAQFWMNISSGSFKIAQDLCKFKSTRNAPNKGISDFTNGLVLSTNDDLEKKVREKFAKNALEDATKIGGQAVTDANDAKNKAESAWNQINREGNKNPLRDKDLAAAAAAKTAAETASNNANDANEEVTKQVKAEDTSKAQFAAKQAQLFALTAKRQAQIAEAAFDAKNCRTYANALFVAVVRAYGVLESAYKNGTADTPDSIKFHSKIAPAERNRDSAPAETPKANTFYTQAHAEAMAAFSSYKEAKKESKTIDDADYDALSEAIRVNTLPTT